MSTAPSTEPIAVTAPAADAKPPRRGVNMPAWLAILIVVLVTAGAGYAGWKLLAPAPTVDLTQYESNDRRGRFRPNNAVVNRPGPNAAPAMVEGVKLNADGTGTAQTNGFGVRFVVSPQPKLFPMSTIGGAAPDDVRAIRARTQVLNDNNARAAVGVNDEQVKKLSVTVLRQPPVVDRDRQTKLMDLWGKLRTADAAAKPAAEKAVMDAVREAEATYRTARSTAYRTHAEAIRSILSADQITKLAQR